MMSNSQVGSYTYPTNGIRPHAVQTAGGNTYSYDDNGNMTSGAGRAIIYDYDNRPVSITAGGVTTTFLYDGGGARVKKTSNGVSTVYIGKLYENTPDGCVKYIFAVDQRIAMRDAAGSLFYYHTDHLGSSSVVTDASGNMVESIAYFPYGQTRINTGTKDVHHKFTGQELDAETGLYFYNARYYDPQLGRFISADTIVPNPRNPQDLNRYSYVSNNPLNYIDPTGHSWFSKAWHDVKDTLSEWGEEIKQFLDKNDINVNAGVGGTMNSGGHAEPIGYNPETGETFPYMPISAVEVSTVSMGEWIANGVGGPGASQQEFIYVEPQGEVFVNPTGGEMRGCDPKGLGCGNYEATRDRNWGKGYHLSIDLISIPGQDVFAAHSGTSYVLDRTPKYPGVQIVGNRYTSRTLYITPSDAIRNAGWKGLTVNAGDVIGTANDIRPIYGQGITNHVHFQLQRNEVSGLIDPTPFIFPNRR